MSLFWIFFFLNSSLRLPLFHTYLSLTPPPPSISPPSPLPLIYPRPLYYPSLMCPLPIPYPSLTCPLLLHYIARPYRNSSCYNNALDQVEENVDIDHLKSLVCRKEPRSACQPDDNSDSLLSLSNLANSLFSPRLVCKRNPCPKGFLPNVDDRGYFHCENLIATQSIQPRNKANCKRNQVLLYGRCRPRRFKHKKRSKSQYLRI